jgi:hypothetical protein
MGREWKATQQRAKLETEIISHERKRNFSRREKYI